MDNFSQALVSILQTFPAEVPSIITLAVCGLSIIGLMHWFGKEGLYCYQVIAIIVANLQVLKMVKFSLVPEPMALGTVVFATTFFVSDLLTEHYGAGAAKRALGLSFIMQILVVVLMLLNLGHPLLNYQALEPELAPELVRVLMENDKSLVQIFSPSLRLLFASMIAYVLSQSCDIWIFKKIREFSNNRFVWLRQNLSTTLSGLLDNFVFSLFAWVILSPNPISCALLINSFVMASFVLRVIINFSLTPLMYWSYKLVPHNISKD